MLAACVWIAYLLVPAERWGLLQGRPLGLLSAAMLAIVCWLAGTRRSTLPWRVMVVALVLKAGLGSVLLVPHGFSARYYANANFAGPIERGTEPADTSFSRTDHRLRFGIDPAPDVPLAFFNDEARFNFYGPHDPERQTLPFSVSWQGFLRVTSAQPQAIYLTSPGGGASISIGDTFSARVDPGARWSGTVALVPGFHRIAITWSVPQGGARQIDAGRIVNGRDEPFDDAVIVRRRADAPALAADAAIRAASLVFDACVIAWLCWQLVIGAGAAYRRLRTTFRPRDAIGLAWLFGIGDALAAAAPSIGRSIILSGGDDWLTYESHARDIGLNGLWMTGGAALGHGQPFFQQPLYPYFLAACHFLFGDGLFGPYFVQRLFAAATVIVLWRTTARLFDELTGMAALVTAVVVVFEKFVPWSTVLLTETLFVPLVCLWMYLLVRFAGAPSRRNAVAAGIVGGLATLARSSLLLGWIGVVPALAFTVGRRRSRLGLLALLLTAAMAVISLATIRNIVVAHRLVAISSEGSIVLFVGNASPHLSIPAAHKALYERVGLEPLTQQVIEYARQQPRAFADGLWQKAKYTLGWFGAMRPGSETSLLYLAIWVSAIIGVTLLPWIAPRAALPLVIIPLLVALTHFAVVVLFQPHVYGDRLLMPLYVLLVPYAALPLAAAARIAVRFGRERAAGACGIVLLLALIARMLDRLAGIDIDLLTVVLVIGGIGFAGLPELRPLRVTIYLAYAGVLATWLVRAPSAARGTFCRAEWLFLIVALFSEALVPRRGTLVPMSRTNRVQRLFIYAAGAALAIAVLYACGIPVVTDRAWLAGRIAAFGIAGTIVYVLVWIEGAWPARRTAGTTAAAGVVLGTFAGTLYGVDLAAAGAAPLLLAALAIGATRPAPRADPVRSGAAPRR